MTTDDNKALVQRFFEEVINQRNLTVLDQFVTPGGVNHTVPPGMPQETNQFLGQYLNAFPDVKATVEDLMADGDKVVARVSYRGTQQSPIICIGHNHGNSIVGAKGQCPSVGGQWETPCNDAVARTSRFLGGGTNRGYLWRCMHNQWCHQWGKLDTLTGEHFGGH